MIPETPRTVCEPTELKASYVHEVAHAAVALHFGCEIALEVRYDRSLRYFDGVCYFRHPDGELPPSVLRAIALAGIVGESAYRLGWGHPRLTVASLGDNLRSGTVDISDTDKCGADGWQVEDLGLAFEILSNAWGWIVEEAERQAHADHPWLVAPPAVAEQQGSAAGL